MRYDTRAEVERIGQAGSKVEYDKYGVRYRYLSSFWLYIEPEDRAFSPHALSGFWESWVTVWISKELEKCGTFIDVGANVGYYTMLAGTSRVHTISVEPNPTLTDNLMRGTQINKCSDMVNVVPLALSDTIGTINLIVPEGHSGGASLMDRDEPEYYLPTYKVASVQQTTLDRGFAFGFMPTSILMKIDAEGAEPRIWDGMQETWYRHNVTVVLEWHGVRWSDERRLNFARKLFQHDVYLLNHDGHEEPITIDWLMSTNDLHMIIVRKKNERI